MYKQLSNFKDLINFTKNRRHLTRLTNSPALALFIVLLLCARSSLAQLTITYPVSRLVVQRDNNNRATVQIAGSCPQPLDVVEARVVARVPGQGTTTDWVTIQTNPVNGQFNGTMTVEGGWYTVQVRGQVGGIVVATSEIDRFGVGEVFAIMGHSNAQGSGCTINGVNQCPTIGGASDDRVNVIAVNQKTSTFFQYLNTADTQYLPGLEFSQLLIDSGMSPFAEIPWLWGHMGDVLVARINVPVLLYNAGFGGTSMEQTYWAAYDIPFSHSFVRYDLRMPYANVRNLMNLYVPTTGIRAVLIQHGENDRDNPADLTFNYYRGVIDKIRTEFNKPELAHFVALSSFFGGRFDNPRNAQQRVIDLPNYRAFRGPDLDEINSQADRPDGAHYSPTGQVKAGEMWANAISDAYLSASTPYAAQLQPLASLACAPSNQLTITQPSGYQSIWDTGSTSNSITVGPGTYAARIIDGQKKVLFPPAVLVPLTVQPAKPVISSSTGTTSICFSNGLTLNSSYTGPNNWSNGNSTRSITVTTPGVYTVQAKNPMYGCLSDPASSTISLAATDISLLMKTSRRVVALNDTVSYHLIVKNNSGCDAGQIAIQNLLPPNMTVVSAGNNLSVGSVNGNSQSVSGFINRVLAGQSVSSRYIVRLTAPGTYVNTAELTSITNPDPNITPANGTENGEKDEARADLRTDGSSTNLFTSPNPNQQPLPPVQSNQPIPNASEADLSLQIEANQGVVRVGQSVVFILTVQNRGGLTATNIKLNSLLPAGVQFVSAVGLTASNNLLSSTIESLAPGQSIDLRYTVKVIYSGTIMNQAQITASDQPDFDSSPNNGYSNGEDDEVRLDLRAID